MQHRQVSMTGLKTMGQQTTRQYVDNVGKVSFPDLTLLGQGVEFFNPQADVSTKFDIIPYEISTVNDPATRDGMAVGDTVVMLAVWMHMGLGANKNPAICLTQYGKPCPACQEAAKLRDQAAQFPRDSQENKDLYNASKDFAAKLRNVMWVRAYVSGQPENKLRVFHVSPFFFTEALEALVRTRQANTGKFSFFNTDNTGSTVCATPTATTFGKALEFGGIDLIDRQAEIPLEVLQMATPLDKLLVIPTAEEMEAQMYGEVEELTQSQPIAQVQRPVETVQAPQGYSQPQATYQEHAPMESEPDVTIDFGGGPVAAQPTVTTAQPQGCPSNFRFGKDWNRKPECAQCPNNKACEAF